MTPERYAHIKALFLEVREQEAAQREGTLERRCVGDPELRRAVEGLLAHDGGDSVATPGAARLSAAQTPRFTPGEVFAERYRIVSRLGRGGMGEVYRADDLTLGAPVALKFLHAEGPQHLARLLEEVRLAREVTHRAVCRVFDVGEAEGRHFFTMESIEGEDLASQLRRIGRLPAGKVLELARELCAGLAAAHERGVLHRDLKPANIMVDARGRARILDFGIAIREGTSDGAALGTPAYLAPEQLVPGGAVTEQTDLYALGLVLYELVTGRAVFPSASLGERRAIGGQVELEPLAQVVPELDPRLEQLILQALREDPGERPSSTAAAGRLLEVQAFGAGQASEATAGLGEERQLTVLFCELAATSGASEPLDLEARSEWVRAYRETIAHVVERFEGHVVDSLGDGVLAAFGYPRAHDDDAVRAVTAALRIVAELSEQATALEENRAAAKQPRFRVAVAVDTGRVVVGERDAGTERERPAVGEPVSVAARLVRAAEPGWVVISERTRRLVQGVFVLEDLGDKALAGVAAAMPTYRARRTTGVYSRLQLSARAGLTPLIGREHEVALLRDRWERASEGHGQVVLLSGEPGIGKSRLLQALRERLSDERHSWLECRGSAFHTNSALHPMIELIEQALLFGSREEDAEKIERLGQALDQAGFEVDETLPLFAALLSIGLPDRHPPLHLSAEAARRRTLEALGMWLLNLAEQQPVVLVAEDLHWVDPSSLELLGRVIEQAPTAPVLLLLSFRPEFEPPWGTPTHLAHLTLGPLTRRQTAALVEAIAGDNPLSPPVRDRVIRRTDGVPLFVEELTKAVLESSRFAIGDGRPTVLPPQLEIPATLRESLEARLDRLGPARELSRVAAVLGREFPYELLEAVVPTSRVKLRESLGRLVQAELLLQRGLPPQATYSFKHSLIHTHAYDGLLPSRRREHHARVAEVLEERFPERVAREPEEIARHCEEAGRTAEAVDYYRRAGERAVAHFAPTEAIAHLKRALELLCTLPDSAERTRYELQLQVALGGQLDIAKGSTDPEVEHVYERARVLSQGVGDRPEIVRIILGLTGFYTNRGQLRTAVELGEQALRIAKHSNEAFPLLAAHYRLGWPLFLMGELRRAFEHLERASRFYDAAAHGPGPSTGIQDFGLSARYLSALVLGLRGHPDRARRLMRQTITLARECDPFNLALALTADAHLHRYLRESRRARVAAEEVIALARERGFPYFLAVSSALRGWAVGGSLGLEESRKALEQLVAAEARTYAYIHGCDLAEMYHEHGRLEDAATAFDTAVAARGEGRVADSMLERVRGELLLHREGAGQAEVCFRRAVEIAQEQGAKWLELQAATRLGRLLKGQGRRGEARALLQPVYGCFTEGFDLPDLKDAKTLLEEL